MGSKLLVSPAIFIYFVFFTSVSRDFEGIRVICDIVEIVYCWSEKERKVELVRYVWVLTSSNFHFV